MWDSETGQLVATIPPQEREIFTVRFSPDGRWILMDGAEQTVRAWNAETGEPATSTLSHGLAVTALAFAPDARQILTASRDRTWRIWDLADNAALSPAVEFPHAIMQAEFDPTGQRIVASEYSSRNFTNAEVNRAYILSTAAIWQTNVFVEHNGPISRAEFSPDGRLILSVSGDLTTRVWDAENARPISPIFHDPLGIIYAAFSRAGDMIVTVTVDRRVVRLWRTGTWQTATPALLHDQPVLGAVFSYDGSAMATGTGWLEAERYGEARIWNVKSGGMMLPPLKHSGPVCCVRFSPDGQRLASAWSPPGEAPGGGEIWDSRSGRHLISLPHADGVNEVEFSPDGRWILTASQDKTARIWNALTGAPVGQVMRHKRSVVTAQFSYDGRLIVTGSHDGTVRVWDATNGEPVTPALRCGGMVWSAEFNPQGDKILAGSGDWGGTGQIHVWALPEIRYPKEEVEQLAQLLSGSDIDRAGALSAVKPEELFTEWRNLKAKHPSDFFVTPEARLHWHRTQGEGCLASKQWSGAAFHFKRCLEIDPQDETVRSELALAESATEKTK